LEVRHKKFRRQVHMGSRFFNFLNFRYPQNYIIRNPFVGAIILSSFFFGFSYLYRPADFHASRSLSFGATMAVYSLAGGFSLVLFTKILKNIRWFADISEWTILKELISVLIILLGISIVVYFLGFAMEANIGRWNVRTFLNSFKNVFSVGIIPFVFFMSVNYSYFFSKNIKYTGDTKTTASFSGDPAEEPVRICSQLKKESVNFYPSQFIYAESEGNYVVFYFTNNNQIRKQIIRNSITIIEKQLSGIPFILRTHRSFIVNLKKVRSKQGNILGYQLKLSDSDTKVPVSRNRVKIFDMQFTKYKIG
jgi:hypothetical protein